MHKLLQNGVRILSTKPWSAFMGTASQCFLGGSAPDEYYIVRSSMPKSDDEFHNQRGQQGPNSKTCVRLVGLLGLFGSMFTGSPEIVICSHWLAPYRLVFRIEA